MISHPSDESDEIASDEIEGLAPTFPAHSSTSEDKFIRSFSCFKNTACNQTEGCEVCVNLA